MVTVPADDCDEPREGGITETHRLLQEILDTLKRMEAGICGRRGFHDYGDRNQGSHCVACGHKKTRAECDHQFYRAAFNHPEGRIERIEAQTCVRCGEPRP